MFFSLAVILKAPIISYFSQNAAIFANYYFWIFPWAFFIVYQNIFATYSNVLMRIVIPRTVQEVIIRIFNMAILLMFAFNVIDIHWLVALQVMVYGVAMLINFLYIARIDKLSLRHDNSFVPAPMRKEIASYAGYTLLASVGTTIMQRVDSFMIAGMLGLESLGIYRIAMYMGIISEIPSRSLFAIAQPVAAEAIKNNDISALKNSTHNVLEEVTKRMHPEIREIEEVMYSHKADLSMMTGSGPTVFGFFQNDEDIKTCADKLKETLKDVFILKI